MYLLFVVFLQKMTKFAHQEDIINKIKKTTIMKTIGYIGAFLGGAIAGAALGILMAPEKGTDTREKISDAIDDFCKKHNINLSKKEIGDLADDIKETVEEVID